jgi:hypothetical protein
MVAFSSASEYVSTSCEKAISSEIVGSFFAGHCVGVTAFKACALENAQRLLY